MLERAIDVRAEPAEVSRDGLDNDCSGTIDGPDAIDTTQWYADGDGDGHGDPLTGTSACTAPTDHVTLNDDCDDSDPATFIGVARLDDPDACLQDIDNDIKVTPSVLRKYYNVPEEEINSSPDNYQALRFILPRYINS